MRILRSITIKKASSRRSLMSLCYKTISSCCSCAYVEILSTWEVWRALKRLELHSAAPRATLTPLSCSPNFLRAQYLDIRTLMHELIVNYSTRVLTNGTLSSLVYAVLSHGPVPVPCSVFLHAKMLGNFIVFLESFQVRWPGPVTQWTCVFCILSKISLWP